MAYYEKERRQKILFGQGNDVLVTLIAINLILFVILIFIKAVLHLQSENALEAKALFDNSVMTWFALPADLSKFASRPWTILTHMFVHDGLWHVFGNMLWLWAFGHILQDLTGNRKIFPVFFYGAMAGAISFILAYNLLPGLKAQLPVQSALGASAGVMAIAVGATFIAPGYRIFPMLNGGIPPSNDAGGPCCTCHGYYYFEEHAHHDR